MTGFVYCGMQKITIKKSDISNIKVDELNGGLLSQNEILVKVDRFAFTSNNVTYAVLGESYKYWEFFPSNDGRGIIPVWGFADVVESEDKEVHVGERIYGYFPMSTHLKMLVGKAGKIGFVDFSPHRKELPGIYNQYMRVGSQPFLNADLERPFMIFQPLVATSFLLEDYHRSNQYFGSRNVIITSASSKTALIFAYFLNKNNKDIRVVGLTSENNVEFVKSLGCYNDVFSYNEIEELPREDCSLVDFSGNRELMVKIQNQQLEHLKFCSIVGMSHWDKGGIQVKYPYKSEVFFAPAHAQARRKEWGAKEFNTRLYAEIFPFLQWSMNWMKFKEVKGVEQMISIYDEVLNGKIDPSEGIVMSF